MSSNEKKRKVSDYEIDYNTTSFIDQAMTSTRSERKRKPTEGSPRISKRKLTLQETLLKIINSLRQKDTFKFFLNPVDTRQVPDYRLIIKNPMDLGRIFVLIFRDNQEEGYEKTIPLNRRVKS